MKKETEEMLQNLKDKSNLSMDDILKSVINFSEIAPATVDQNRPIQGKDLLAINRGLNGHFSDGC